MRKAMSIEQSFHAFALGIVTPLGRRLAERPKGTQQGSVLTALRAVRKSRPERVKI